MIATIVPCMFTHFLCHYMKNYIKTVRFYYLKNQHYRVLNFNILGGLLTNKI
jgi:hypothetical protein